MSEVGAAAIGSISGINSLEQVKSNQGEQSSLWAREKVTEWLPSMTQFTSWLKQDSQSASRSMLEGFIKQPETANALLGLTGELVGTGDLAREDLLIAYYAGLGLKPERVKKAAKAGGEIIGLTEKLWLDGLKPKELDRLLDLTNSSALSKQAKNQLENELKQINLGMRTLSSINALTNDASDSGFEARMVRLEEQGGGEAGPPKPPNWWDNLVEHISRNYQKFVGRLSSRGGPGQRLVRMLSLSADLEHFGYEVAARALALAVTLGIGLTLYITTTPFASGVEERTNPVAAEENSITATYGADQLDNFHAASGFMDGILSRSESVDSFRSHLVNIADFNRPPAKELFLVTVDAYRFELQQAKLESRQKIYDYMRTKGYSDTEANYLADVGAQILQTKTGGNFQEYQDVLDKAKVWQGTFNPKTIATVPQKTWKENPRLRDSKPVAAARKHQGWF